VISALARGKKKRKDVRHVALLEIRDALREKGPIRFCHNLEGKRDTRTYQKGEKKKELAVKSAGRDCSFGMFSQEEASFSTWGGREAARTYGRGGGAENQKSVNERNSLFFRKKIVAPL